MVGCIVFLFTKYVLQIKTQMRY